MDYVAELKNKISDFGDTTSDRPSIDILIHMINDLNMVITGKQSAEANGKSYMFVPFKDTKLFLAPILKAAGLSVAQEATADGDNVIIYTTIMDMVAYETKVSMFKQKMFNINGLNIGQANASVITMTKNNVLKTLFGILTNEDTDGAGEEVKQAPGKKVLIRGTETYQQVVKLLKGDATMDELKKIYIINPVLEGQLEHDSQ
jgi:hypothetical protein